MPDILAVSSAPPSSATTISRYDFSFIDLCAVMFPLAVLTIARPLFSKTRSVRDNRNRIVWPAGDLANDIVE